MTPLPGRESAAAWAWRGSRTDAVEACGLLAKGLEEDDGDAVGEVEGAAFGVGHGDVEPAVAGGFEEGVRKAGGFTAEGKDIAGGEPSRVVGAGRALLDEPDAGVGGKMLEEGGPVGPAPPLEVLPVVHAGAAELAVVEIEAKGLDEVKGGLGGGAEAGDAAGVGGDFRLEEDDVEHGSGTCALAACVACVGVA